MMGFASLHPSTKQGIVDHNGNVKNLLALALQPTEACA